MTENTLPPKKRRGLKVVLIIVSILLLMIVGFGFLLWWEVTREQRELKVSNVIVLAPELNLTEKGKDGTLTSIETIPYGTILEIRTESTRQEGKIYNKIVSSSIEQDKYKKKNYYIESTDDSDLESAHRAERIKRTFTQKITQQLPAHIKKAIIYATRNDYYYFTQDANRIKSAIVTADFNMDNENDIAIVLEQNNLHQLFILCYNKDLQQSYLAHSDINSGLALIQPFSKNALIFMDSEQLVKAPNNGIIYESTQKDGFKYAILYDPKRLQFCQYLQVPLSKQQHYY